MVFIVAFCLKNEKKIALDKMHKKKLEKLTSIHTRDEKKVKNHTTFLKKRFNMLVN